MKWTNRKLIASNQKQREILRDNKCGQCSGMASDSIYWY